MLKALQAVRGNDRVTDQNPEAKFQALEKYGIDLVERASQGKLDPVIGRDQEIRRVIQVLSRRTKNNPVLIGEPGVGKTAIAEGLALRIVAGRRPAESEEQAGHRPGYGRRWWPGPNSAASSKSGSRRCSKRCRTPADVILFIDELHTVVGAGKAEGGADAANLLKPALARGELRCIGATTLDEYRQYIEKDAALERRFQPVYVGEPSVEDTIAILRGLKGRYEAHHKGVKVKDSALVAAATLSHRYITDRFLPDKAIDLVDEVDGPAGHGIAKRAHGNRPGAAAAGAIGIRGPATGRRERRARQGAAGRDRTRDERSPLRTGQSARAVGSREARHGRLGEVRSTVGESRAGVPATQSQIKERQSAGMPIEEDELSAAVRTGQRTQASLSLNWKRTRRLPQPRWPPSVGCCARKSARKKSPKSSVPGPAFRSLA